MSWSYRLEGTRIVGGFFGLRFVDAELRGAKVRLETVPAGYVATTDVIVIVGATIHRRLSLFDRSSAELCLGSSMWIGRKRREFWLSQIRTLKRPRFDGGCRAGGRPGELCRCPVPARRSRSSSSTRAASGAATRCASRRRESAALRASRSSSRSFIAQLPPSGSAEAGRGPGTVCISRCQE